MRRFLKRLQKTGFQLRMSEKEKVDVILGFCVFSFPKHFFRGKSSLKPIREEVRLAYFLITAL